MKSVVLLLAITVMGNSGCAMRGSKKMNQIMQSWEGQPITAVVAAWGAPAQVYDEGDKKVYVWSNQSTYQAPGRIQTSDYGFGVQTQTTYPGASRTRNYYRMFWVENGTVVSWQWGVN